jgi:predicted kinase
MPNRQFLLQMAGMPGAGKSALARLIGRSTKAIVLDKDVLKTAALEAGADEKLASGIAYDTFFALASHMLSQGWTVVLDSPSFWATIPKRGSELAAERHVPYFFIECYCDDDLELARRLRERTPMASQPGVEVLDESWETIPPPDAHLRVDTTQPIDHSLSIALDYLGRSE